MTVVERAAKVGWVRPPRPPAQLLPTVGLYAIRTFAVATIALAPLEGYLQAINGQLSKLAPVLLILAWAAVRAGQRSMPQLHIGQVVLGLLLAVVFASAALATGGDWTLAHVVRWVPFLIVTVVLIDVAAQEVSIRMLLIAAVTGAVIAGLGAIYSFVVQGASRAAGPLGDPGDLAYVLAAALPLLVGLLPGANTRWRATSMGIVALSGVVLLIGMTATLSRGGIMATAAVVVFLVWRRVIQMRVVAWIAAGGLVVGGIAAAVAWDTVQRALGEKAYIGGGNVDSRLLRWEAAARMLTDNPLLGVGPGQFRELYANYSGLAEIHGMDLLAENTPVAHNMYIEVAAELGALGFLLFVGVMVLAFVSCERSLATSDRRTVIAIEASLIAVMVASFFLSQQYYLPLWEMIAAACALHIRAMRRGCPSGAGAACYQ